MQSDSPAYAWRIPSGHSWEGTGTRPWHERCPSFPGWSRPVSSCRDPGYQQQARTRECHHRLSHTQPACRPSARLYLSPWPLKRGPSDDESCPKASQNWNASWVRSIESNKVLSKVYFVTLPKWIFQTSISFSQTFLFLPPTFVHRYLHFLLLTVQCKKHACYFCFEVIWSTFKVINLFVPLLEVKLLGPGCWSVVKYKSGSYY